MNLQGAVKGDKTHTAGYFFFEKATVRATKDSLKAKNENLWKGKLNC